MRLVSYTLALPLLALSCAKDPAAGKEKATIEAAAPLAEKGATVAKRRFAFTSETTRLQFLGAKLSAQHEGSFPDVSGTIELTTDAPESGTVRLEVGIASLQIEPAKLGSHLMSPDFFDAQRFPKARFESVSLTKTNEKSYTVKGNLNLHGVTKQLSFPATIEDKGQTLKVRAEFALNRKDFGIVYPGKPDDLIQDNVLIKLQLTARTQ